jgi:predicted nucleic acid-binding protein
MTRTNGRVEILDYLQRVADRIRELARTNPSDMRYQVLAIADQIAEEAAGLEAELIDAGYLPPKPTKKP